jgi:PBSX family phage terminase large subunit
MAKQAVLAAFKFQKFSRKQKQVLTWWKPGSPFVHLDTILCDGSIRSGKTIAFILSFILWSTSTFDGEDFIVAGKTLGALKRNVVKPMLAMLNAMGVAYEYVRSGSDPHISIGTNTYYLFGANNEASQDSIQGLTAAGVLMDEAALFPMSFIDQAVGRCSVEGSRIWMNCNPEGPFHPLKTDYIDKADQKGVFYLHFDLDDNLTLSPAKKRRYRQRFSGVFYRRYILGLWALAEGVIYDQFDAGSMVVTPGDIPEMKQLWLGADHGTSNATAIYLLGIGQDNRLYVIHEYYHSGRKSGRQKSPAQYSKEFRAWLEKIGSPSYKWLFVDPAATGFIAQLYEDGVQHLAQADNDVKGRIEFVSSLIGNNLFRVSSACPMLIQNLSNYAWDPKAQARGEDTPIKVDDDPVDGMGYGAYNMRHLWRGLLKEAA